LLDRIARAERVILDVGTGDGRAVVARARAEPSSLVLGVDADARAMAESSRRAARPATRGGLQNTMFLVAAAEQLPGPMAGRVSLVTVTFPWGSLLAGALGRDPAVASGLAGLVGPGGRIEMLASIETRDRAAGNVKMTAQGVPVIGAAWESHGLTLTCLQPATIEEILASHSTWGRRLTHGGGAGRTVWRLELEARLG
jgi:16S rRNA (adenine(1408)-N(1))-methyltransferase